MITNFKLVRSADDDFSTIGSFKDHLGMVLCYILERSKGDKKHPRIPAGIYPIRFRKIGESHFDPEYQKIIGLDYEGMPEICDVPGRKDILIHCGNKPTDSLGCLMTGQKISHEESGYEIVGGTSQPAYRNLYPILLRAWKNGGAMLEVIDP